MTSILKVGKNGGDFDEDNFPPRGVEQLLPNAVRSETPRAMPPSSIHLRLVINKIFLKAESTPKGPTGPLLFMLDED